ncbi:hypothetical protein [Nonomuraea wenchangensis]|uniref:hypothetical protein n=1 Tax=Nonomuraea wenchangensis TaxID=568860 RepID=UPI0033E5EAFB
MRSRNTSAQLEELELGKPVTEAEADRQRAALDRVLEHMLETVGVHAELITRIALDCERRPEPSAEKPATDMHRDWIAVVPAHLPDQAAPVIAQHAGCTGE